MGCVPQEPRSLYRVCVPIGAIARELDHARLLASLRFGGAHGAPEGRHAGAHARELIWCCACCVSLVLVPFSSAARARAERLLKTIF